MQNVLFFYFPKTAHQIPKHIEFISFPEIYWGKIPASPEIQMVKIHAFPEI